MAQDTTTIPETNAAEALEAAFADIDTPEAPLGDDTNDFVSKIFEDEPSDPPETETEDAETEETDTKETKTEETETEETEESEETEEGEDPPDSKDKRTHEWRELKAKRAEAETARKEVETKLAEATKVIEELQAKTTDLDAFKEKAEFFEEAQKELAISRIEATHEFKETIDKPLKVIEKEMEALAKENEVSLERIFDALESPDPAKRRAALKEVTADMDEVDRNDVIAAARKTQELLARRVEIHENAVEAAKEAKEVREAREAEAVRKAKAEFKTAATQAIGGLRERVPFEELAGDGQDAEKLAESLVRKIEGDDYTDAPTGLKAVAAASAVLMPRVIKRLNDSLAETRTLKARVKELTSKGGAPADLGGGSAEDAPETGDPFDDIARELGTTGVQSGNVLDKLKSLTGG